MERKRPPQKRGERRRQLLVESAYKMLRDKGNDEFGYPEIAKRAQIPLSSCYHFYGCKDDLLAAVAVEKISPIWAGLLDELAQAPASIRWIEMVQKVLEQAQTSFEDNAGASVLAFATVTVGRGYEANFINVDTIVDQIAERIEVLYQVPEYTDLRWSLRHALLIWSTMMREAYVRPGVFKADVTKMAVDAVASYLQSNVASVFELKDSSVDVTAIEYEATAV